jgi:hypothetical protein
VVEAVPVESRFDTYEAYRQAVATVVAQAQRELAIFDPDLKETGLESRAGAEHLVRLLATSRGRQLRIVLHDPGHLERHCPRLITILRDYGHVASLRRTPGNLRNLTDCFVVADGRHAVIRFHADHARGKLLIAQDDEVGIWQRRFAELWELATATSCITTLGL